MSLIAIIAGTAELASNGEIWIFDITGPKLQGEKWKL